MRGRSTIYVVTGTDPDGRQARSECDTSELQSAVATMMCDSGHTDIRRRVERRWIWGPLKFTLLVGDLDPE